MTKSRSRQRCICRQPSKPRGSPRDPPAPLLAFQAYLQSRVPWGVVVPFADELAARLASQPVEARVARNFARLLSLVKAVGRPHQRARRRDAERCRLVAEVVDYATVYELVNEMYGTSSGAGEKVRAVVEAVKGLLLHDGAGLHERQ